jgi:hypothetical protein
MKKLSLLVLLLFSLLVAVHCGTTIEVIDLELYGNPAPHDNPPTCDSSAYSSTGPSANRDGYITSINGIPLGTVFTISTSTHPGATLTANITETSTSPSLYTVGVNLTSTGTNDAWQWINIPEDQCFDQEYPITTVGTDYIGHAFKLTNRRSKIVGDPHFSPLSENQTISAMRYTPKSDRDGVYNIFSNKFVQWNSQWTIYNDMPAYHLPQFSTQEGFVFKHPSFTNQQAKNEGHVDSVELLFKLDTGAESRWLITNVETRTILKGDKNSSPLVAVPFVDAHKKFFFFGEEYPNYYVHMPNRWDAVLVTPFLTVSLQGTFMDLHHKHGLTGKQKRELSHFPKYQWPFYNAAVTVDDAPGMKDSHGLLGQTLRPECPYSEPRDGCVPCFVKGEIEDYRIQNNDIFGNQFKFNKFH